MSWCCWRCAGLLEWWRVLWEDYWRCGSYRSGSRPDDGSGSASIVSCLRSLFLRWLHFIFRTAESHRSSHPGRAAFEKRDPTLRTGLLLSLCPSGTDFSAFHGVSPITPHVSLLIV